MPGQQDRQFEIRHANALLAALVANADDGIIEASMRTLATLAGLSRVQAQVGLKVLKRHGRVRHERRGTRNRPGRFRIVSDELVSAHAGGQGDPRTPTLLLDASRSSGPTDEDTPSATVVALLLQENEALKREVAALRERLEVAREQDRLIEQLAAQLFDPPEPGGPRGPRRDGEGGD